MVIVLKSAYQKALNFIFFLFLFFFIIDFNLNTVAQYVLQL